MCNFGMGHSAQEKAGTIDVLLHSLHSIVPAVNETELDKHL